MALRPSAPPAAAVVSYTMHTQRSRLSMYDTNVSMISTTWKLPLMVDWYLRRAREGGGAPGGARCGGNERAACCQPQAACGRPAAPSAAKGPAPRRRAARAHQPTVLLSALVSRRQRIISSW